MSETRFVRIRGKIVPIGGKAKRSPKQKNNDDHMRNINANARLGSNLGAVAGAASAFDPKRALKSLKFRMQAKTFKVGATKIKVKPNIKARAKALSGVLKGSASKTKVTSVLGRAFVGSIFGSILGSIATKKENI